MADDEEVIEDGGEAQEEPELKGAEFVPEITSKPKPDVYSAMLVIGFLAFLTGVILATNELHDFYDVQFWVFSKK